MNLLRLDDPKDSFNLSVRGPMDFIGIGRSPVR